MARYRVALAAIAFLLTGCTTTISGMPLPVPPVQEDKTPLTSRLALGDVTTIDYCSLLDLDGVEKVGVSGVGPTTSTFNYCFAGGNLGGRSIEFGVGYLERDSEPGDRLNDPTRTLGRGLVAQRSVSSDSMSCVYYLKFTDSMALQVYADDTGSGSGSSGPLCDVAGSVLDGLTDLVLAKKVGHQSFPAGSAGTVDACGLLSDDQVAAYYGIHPLRTPVIPTKHRCRWQNPATRDALIVQFDGGAPPGGSAETIAGRQTSVSDASRSCLVSTTLGPASGSVTLAQVFVIVRAGTKPACDAARRFANAVWPKLPAS